LGRVAIFIDGGYFEYVQHSLGNPRVPFDKFAAALTETCGTRWTPGS
jgi:hypothetical protein